MSKEPDINLYDKLKEVIANHGSDIALQLWTDGAPLKKYSYREMGDEIGKKAAILKNLNLPKGSHIALIGNSSPLWTIAFFAILASGNSAVLLDAHLAPDDYSMSLSKVPVAIIVASKPQMSLLPQSLKGTMVLDIEEFKEQKVDEPNLGAPPLFSSSHSFKTCSSDEIPTKEVNKAGDPSIAVILFTSGTTGGMKAAMIEHSALLLQAKSIYSHRKWKRKENLLSILPLSHIAGLVGTLIFPLQSGFTVTYMHRVDAAKLPLAISQAEVTLFLLVPRILELLVRRLQHGLDKYPRWLRMPLVKLMPIMRAIRRYSGINLAKLAFFPLHRAFGSSLEHFISGAAMLPPKLQAALYDLGFSLLQAYGLTEGGVVFITKGSNKDHDTVGTALEGVQWRIADPNEKGEGELCINSGMTMRGYYGDERATAEVLKDGWLHTGDLASVTPHGRLRICGRIKELIVTESGTKVSPDMLERKYGHFSCIKEIAVLGLPSPSGANEEIGAAIVLMETKDFEGCKRLKHEVTEAIRAEEKQKEASLRISHFYFFEELPRNARLKIDKKVLRAMIAAQK